MVHSFFEFRLVESKKDVLLSKRVDHLHKKYLGSEVPSLSLHDVWSLIKPYWFLFLAAVISAILAAVVNIQLPIYLGELIDKIVIIIKDQSKGAVSDLGIIKPEAVRLVLCYTAQAVLTFFYISFLTVLGERIAADLRITLFSRLLAMDMAFFDSQKTAELSNRLNVDVQEFKSCFKLTVAQGLRTMAQVGGCVVSLFRISPHMTMYTVAALPVIIAIGTLFGALLRSLSRRAQAQSAIAAAVADEALGNIQTVRAFAMEEQEARLFEREVRLACFLQEVLGMGIGLFQGATNFFLNGMVLSVLYGGSSLIHS
ncbi:ABC transporter transmembrane region, partial [Necator americanus]